MEHAKAMSEKTLLAVGAHYDDCPFGIPGILLQAVRRHYRVVILNIIGDYENWAPVKGRAAQLRELSTSLAQEHGMEMRFLQYASQRFEANEETKRAVAEVVAELKPDIALMLWHQDRHPDHEVAAAICQAALRHPATVLGRDDVRGARRIYCYDNGPGHTIDFEPDAYVDITSEWAAAQEWLGRLMAFVRNRPFDPNSPDGSLTVKETLARYRGMACGVRYAEAIRALGNYPLDIF